MLARRGVYSVIGYGGTISLPSVGMIATETSIAGNLVGSWIDLWELVQLHGQRRDHAALGDVPARAGERRPRTPARRGCHRPRRSRPVGSARRAHAGRDPLVAAARLAHAVRARPLRRVAEERARTRLRRLRGALPLVRHRSRGVLGLDLGLLRDSRARAVRARARIARDARRRVVPGCADQLRRAHGRPRRGRRRLVGGRRALADARAGRADVRRPARAGRAGPRRPAGARRAARRPRRRVPAERPGDARRLPRRGEPRCGLGDVPAGVRSAERAQPARPARADGAVRRRRLPLRRQARRPPPAGGGSPRAGLPSLRSVVHVPYVGGDGRRLARRGGVGRPARDERAARLRRAALRRTRCTSSSHRARRACRSRSSTGTAASSSST